MPDLKHLKTVLNGQQVVYDIFDPVARQFAEDNAHLWNVGQSPVLYVSKENSRFTTINSAIDYAEQYCTTTNRVIILISSGMYEEYIDLDDNPGIDFMGIGNVVIRSSVAWRLSTLRCSNSIYVDNIQFENYYTPGPGEHAGYGLHADPITGFQTYRNCSFYSNNNSAVGIGMGQGGQANFYNCYFRSALGGIYAHNNAQDGTTGQWLRFYDCNIESTDGSNVIRIDDAASMANSSRQSQMGMVFVNCTGNNHGVTYRYDNPTQVLPYIPTSSSYNVFLYQTSGNNDIEGINTDKQTKAVTMYFNANGSNLFYIPEPDAYKYAWTINTMRYRDYNSGAGTWGSWSNFPSSKTITIESGQPEAFKIVIPGTEGIAPGGRAFELSLNGKPRASYTYPETIT